jgi:hypothetical protein
MTIHHLEMCHYRPIIQTLTETIAKPAHRNDVLWPTRIKLNFFTQPTDMDIHRFAIPYKVKPPNLV